MPIQRDYGFDSDLTGSFKMFLLQICEWLLNSTNERVDVAILRLAGLYFNNAPCIVIYWVLICLAPIYFSDS